MKICRRVRIAISVLAVSLLLVGLPGPHPSVGQNKNQLKTTPKLERPRMPQGMRLSTPALFSRFAREHSMGAVDMAQLMRTEMEMQGNVTALGATPQVAGPQVEKREQDFRAKQVNRDFNQRPQNETSIALRPSTGDGLKSEDDSNESTQFVIGANDYGIGVPLGTGVYNNKKVTYFPPFPLLAALDGRDIILAEPPFAGGDPALAYGFTRAAPGIPEGIPVVYYSSLVFSATFGENGVIVQRSFNNGRDWNQPTVPPFAQPRGIGIATYFDQAFDFSVINDKEYIAVDNTGGLHNGRVYVTWTRVEILPTTFRAPIDMVYSDDNGLTFSDPIEVSGTSQTLCPDSFGSPPGVCDAGIDSVPIVAPDGTLVVFFENFNNEAPPRFRDQFLVTRVNPDNFAVSGPFKVTDIFNGIGDQPFNSDIRATLCNSNFRADLYGGNIAVGQDGTLYATWWDNRAQAGQFPFRTFVGPRSAGYACPAGKNTDANVFLSRSTNGGMNWSAPAMVNKGPSGTDQWFPWVAAGPPGRVDVVFFDRSEDPGNKLANTSVAQSFDGGRTFKQVKVSNFASNFDNAFFGSGRFIGDYNGMAMDSSGRSFPVWTGVRPGKNDSDIFTTIVEP
jgi:hypothetical protein